MKITESIFVKDYTSLSLSESIPFTKWKAILVDGIKYKPIPIMDGGDDCIAIQGNINLTGKEIKFV